MRKGASILLIFVSIMLFANLISAIPPTQTNVNTGSGLEISYPKFDNIVQGKAFNLSVHAYNISTGFEVLTASCELEILDQQGEHVLDMALVFFADEYGLYLTPGNFSQNGIFAYNIYCSAADVAGFADGLFRVTSSGTDPSTSEALLYSISFLGMLIIFSLCAVAAIKIPWKNTRDGEGRILSVNNMKYAKMGFILLSLPLFTWLINLLLGISRFLSLSMYEGLFSFIFNLLIDAAWPFFIVWIIIFFLVIYKDSGIKQMLKKGFKPR